MKLSLIKYTGIIAISLLFSACGGGQGSSENTEPTTTNLTFMVDGIISENLDNADHATWDLDNFDMHDDIDGDTTAEAAINAMVDKMVAENLAQP